MTRQEQDLRKRLYDLCVGLALEKAWSEAACQAVIANRRGGKAAPTRNTGGFAAAVADMPLSSNIEDRRNEVYMHPSVRRHRRGRG